jgi:endogenous inhibitor of DNA gyrase (YacG/DUF329 family)
MNQRAKKMKSLRCPTCGNIDLGKWASGVYRISSPVLDPELLEEIEGMQPRSSGDE